jgi:hypothetical protein
VAKRARKDPTEDATEPSARAEGGSAGQPGMGAAAAAATATAEEPAGPFGHGYTFALKSTVRVDCTPDSRLLLPDSCR